MKQDNHVPLGNFGVTEAATTEGLQGHFLDL
jgi:hypothetical protein